MLYDLYHIFLALIARLLEKTKYGKLLEKKVLNNYLTESPEVATNEVCEVLCDEMAIGQVFCR